MNAELAGIAPWLLDAWLVLVGLSIGSFLNVVIARVPEELSIVRPRSRCPKCGHTLSWYENIPVLSWIALRGRCRGCKAPISFRYVAVELLTGALFLACRVRFGWSWELVAALVLVCLLVPLTFIDLEHWLLPHVITLPGIALGVLTAVPLGIDRLRDSAIGAAAGFLVFWGMEWIGEKVFKKEALGGGDKFLLALIGGFLTWKALLGVIFLSSLQGAVIGVLMIAVYGRAGPAPTEEKPPPEPQDEQPPEQSGGEEDEDDWVPGPTNMPFGPWLAIAALELLLFGDLLAGAMPGMTGRLLGFE